MSGDLVINIKIPRDMMGSGGGPSTIETKPEPPPEDPDPGFGCGDRGMRPRTDGGRRVVVVVDLDGEDDDGTD
jgi:hypothetical protein